MSTSLLYHAFGIRGYRYVATDYQEGEIIVRIDVPRESLRCARCGSPRVHVIERFRRRWRTVPIGAKAVWIDMQVPKVECQKCGARRRVRVKFADPKRQHTRSFERYVCELLQFMTPQDVSWHLGTGTAGLFRTVSPHKQTSTAEETFRAAPRGASPGTWPTTSRSGGWGSDSAGPSSSGSETSPSMKSIWASGTASSRWCSTWTPER